MRQDKKSPVVGHRAKTNCGLQLSLFDYFTRADRRQALQLRLDLAERSGFWYLAELIEANLDGATIGGGK